MAPPPSSPTGSVRFAADGLRAAVAAGLGAAVVLPEDLLVAAARVLLRGARPPRPPAAAAAASAGTGAAAAGASASCSVAAAAGAALGGEAEEA